MVFKDFLRSIAVILTVITNLTVIDQSTYGNEAVQDNQASSQFSTTKLTSQIKMSAIATWSNGDYQLCSKPAPDDWQDGAGVCFRFQKLGQQVKGYYGYPHTDNFVCLKGSTQGNQVAGEAFAVSWEGAEWQDLPSGQFQWDAEGHLILSQAEMVPGDKTSKEWTSKVLFHSAQLDLQGFYRYQSLRMKHPTELCAE